VDLAVLERLGVFKGEHFSTLKTTVFDKKFLNDFMELGMDYLYL
jgi:hypothetical protein